MAYTIDVDPAGYTDAASVTRGLLTDLRAAGHAVVSGLGGSHGMAGSDQGGQTWATDYDQAAKSILGDTSKLLTAFDSIAVALGVTGYNHAVAEHRAGGTGALTASSVPTATAVESLPHPPSAHGGNRQFPWGFQYVSDLIGMAWPDGDTGKLRTAGSRWDAFAAAVDAIDTAGPLASISGFTSPEIAGIESKFSDARQVVSALATEARALARGCRKRADTIEKVHGETEKELIQLAATIGATVAASALLTPFTLGISDAAGAGAVATETGISVARIVAWLTEAVETTIATAGEIAEAISGVSGLGAMIEGLAVRVAPMVVVAGANAVVQGGSSAAIDGVVNGTSANLGEDVLFGALLPGGGALKSAESTGEKLVATGTREAEEAAAAKAAADSERLASHEVVFTPNADHDLAEFDRQLSRQGEGLNKLTVGEYLANRDRYLAEGRSPLGDAAQKQARERAFADKRDELIKAKVPPKQAREQAKEWLKDQAALHDPDQIAGGHPTKVSGVGDTRINSSIGSQWKSRIGPMDAKIRSQAALMTPEQLARTRLNVILKR